MVDWVTSHHKLDIRAMQGSSAFQSTTTIDASSQEHSNKRKSRA
jgi:hypothetical protein